MGEVFCASVTVLDNCAGVVNVNQDVGYYGQSSFLLKIHRKPALAQPLALIPLLKSRSFFDAINGLVMTPTILTTSPESPRQ
jgi:hypothetical protein